MANTDTLRAALRHAEAQRDAAAPAARRAAADAARAEGQLGQLLGYRGEYDARWTQRFAEGAAIDIVRCHGSFATRLGAAVGQQERVAERSAAHAKQVGDAQRERERRVAAIGKLIERREREARQVVARREARMADEWAANAARRRGGGG